MAPVASLPLEKLRQHLPDLLEGAEAISSELRGVGLAGGARSGAGRIGGLGRRKAAPEIKTQETGMPQKRRQPRVIARGGAARVGRKRLRINLSDDE
jgi:hypothetical protein